VDFTALQTELYARGFQYLNDGGAGVTRAKQWLNDSYFELCALAAWPFLETTVTGVAPLTVSDVQKVIYVVDTSTGAKLQSVDVRELTDWYPKLDTTGSPVWWWLDGNTTLRVFPLNTADSLSVRYAKFPATLSASSDTPVVPARYHNLIVDGAVIRAYKDSDNLMSAYALQNDLDGQVQKMRETLLARRMDNGTYVTVSSAYGDGWA